ncbi:uncharacterized protein LOC125647545 [Ostrea edulis]|uniref:uncharacterized protein LOC125647545 n=1 Tax=Ostrea edulis TaxID=37623 RepID=UPI002095A5CA|nr:uncharacterized protein LOC125647545 [Ostrea edulis]
MLDLEKYFVCKSLLVIYAYFCILGLFAHNCSTVKLKGKCTWSAWTDCTSYGDIQHRARVCGASNSEIEGRHCNISDCRESSGELCSPSTASTLQSSSGITQEVINTTEVSAGKVDGTSSSTTQYTSSAPNATNVHDYTVENSNSTSVTENAGSSLSTGVSIYSTSKSLKETGREEKNNDFRYICEVSLAVVTLLLILVSAGYLYERKKRLQYQSECSYTFSLPTNTELNYTREANRRYNTVADITSLVDSRAERLSSCVYHDITDLTSLANMVSSRSTYQQIPF